MTRTVLAAGLVALAAGAHAAGAPDFVTGKLRPVNAESLGQNVTGAVTIATSGQMLVFDVQADGVGEGQHLMHVHGFPGDDPREARCPTMADDANGDGVIDLVEAEAVAGTTMIPFHDAPASMEIPSQSYPDARAAGNLVYTHKVDFDRIQEAMEAKFDSPTALEKRVVLMHTVPQTAQLPDSARSLPDVPAHMTVPIACAELE